MTVPPPTTPARFPAERPRGLGPWLWAGQLLGIVSIAVSNILLGLAVLSSPWTLRGRSPLRPGTRPLLAALAVYVLLLVASVIASYRPAVSVSQLSEAFTLSGLVLALALVRGERQARWLVDAVVVLAAVIALFGLGQLLVGYGDLENRIRGPLSHYMTFAGVLLIADVLLLARLAVGGRRRDLWRWGALVLINVALLGSYTRNSWVALILALALLLLLRAPRALVLLPAAAVLFALLAPVPLLHRASSIFDLADESNYDRICMARAGLTMIAERPAFGLGPEMVEERYPIYRHPTAPRYWVPHLHNSFLQLAAERGLPALAAYLALMGAAALTAWRRFRAEGGFAGPRADLYLGALLALVAFNVAGLFENNWGDTEVQRLVVLALALPYVSRSD